MILAKGGSFDSVLNKLFIFISNSPTEICTRAVECYSFLLRRPDGIDSEGLFADAVLSLNWAIISCQKSIDTTNSNSVEDKELLIAPLLKRLYSLATQPFFEVRVAVFNAIDAIVTQVGFAIYCLLHFSAYSFLCIDLIYCDHVRVFAFSHDPPK